MLDLYRDQARRTTLHTEWRTHYAAARIKARVLNEAGDDTTPAEQMPWYLEPRHGGDDPLEDIRHYRAMSTRRLGGPIGPGYQNRRARLRRPITLPREA